MSAQARADRLAVARGQRAERELELTDSVFDELRAAAIEEWSQTAVGHVDKREKLFFVVSTIEAVRKSLKTMVDDGQVARFALAQQGLTRP